MKMNKKARAIKKNAGFWYRFTRNKSAIIGLVAVSIVVFAAVFANLIAPSEDVLKQDYSAIMQPPSKEHLFGTDQLGRDLFARVIYGSRYSLVIGVTTSLVALLIGGTLGSVAGYFGGAIDNIIMRILDVVISIPAVLLALAIVSALGASLVNLMLALTVALVPGVARLVRSVILTVAEEDYVEAAKAYGASNFRILLRYIVPNAMGTIIISTTINISYMILSAAGLSFIGMGIQPPDPEWGALLGDAKNYMRQAPHMLIFPGLFILLAALGFSLIGDGLRDALDPRLKD